MCLYLCLCLCLCLRHQGTEAHLGQLKARLSKLRKLLPETPPQAACPKTDADLLPQRLLSREVQNVTRANNAAVVGGTDQEVGGLSQYRVSDSGKVRLSMLDLVVQARDLKSSLLGMRLSNIYDFDAKTVVLKLGGSASWAHDAAAAAAAADAAPSHEQQPVQFDTCLSTNSTHCPGTDANTARTHERPVADEYGQDIYGQEMQEVQEDGSEADGQMSVPEMPLALQHAGGGGGGGAGGGIARLAADSLQVAGDSRRALLLVESGVRIHTSKYAHAAPPQPSAFVVKLRKHLRGQRLTDLRVVGGDRLLCLSFGSANWTHHLLVEFYAGGNIILCDSSLAILSLLRPYTAADGQRVAVKQSYPLAELSLSAHSSMTMHKLHTSLERVLCESRRLRAQLGGNTTGKTQTHHSGDSKGGQLNSKSRRQMSLARLLAADVGYAPALVEHALLLAHWLPHVPADDPLARLHQILAAASEDAECSDESASLAALLQAFAQIDALITGHALHDDANPTSTASGGGSSSMSNALSTSKGFILLSNDAVPQMLEVTPLVLLQQANLTVLEHPSLDVALDLYFSTLDKQKGQKALQAHSSDLAKGVEKVANDVDARADGLGHLADSLDLSAQELLLCAPEVDACLQLVRDLLATHRDWKAVHKYVDEAKEQGIVGSHLIHSLKLDDHLVVLLLPASAHEVYQDLDPNVNLMEHSIAADEDCVDARCDALATAAAQGEQIQGTKVRKKRTKAAAPAQPAAGRHVEVDFRLSAMANVRLLFEKKKKVSAKMLRTQEARRLSLDRAQHKLNRQLVSALPPPSLLCACYTCKRMQHMQMTRCMRTYIDGTLLYVQHSHIYMCMHARIDDRWYTFACATHVYA